MLHSWLAELKKMPMCHRAVAQFFEILGKICVLEQKKHTPFNTCLPLLGKLLLVLMLFYAILCAQKIQIEIVIVQKNSLLDRLLARVSPSSLLSNGLTTICCLGKANI